ncbi:hypothetical protein KHQ89_07995 [Mycoplasmatota bacterium]|nr:hypothetical protein KHQ89_07995 [Mycoplasmatota bacterium]
MKSKKLVVSLLVMLAVVMSTLTFAYWQNSVATGNADTASGTITIGAGDDVSVATEVTVNDESSAGKLVPVGNDAAAGDVDDVDLTFSILWEGTVEDVDGDIGTLAVTLGTVMIGSTDVSGLMTVTIPADQTITAGTSLDVVINVEFTNEPANQAAYDAIANGTLTIGLTFTVTVA